jgi:hypothetical protein
MLCNLITCRDQCTSYINMFVYEQKTNAVAIFCIKYNIKRGLCNLLMTFCVEAQVLVTLTSTVSDIIQILDTGVGGFEI